MMPKPENSSKLPVILISLSLGLILLAWTAAAEACPKIFSGRETISPAKGSAFRSPDKQFLAWSVAVLEKDPELVSGLIFLRNERTDRYEIIFETQIKAGKILSSHPDNRQADYNIFCIVDWSSDSTHLLLQEVLGRLYSDVWVDYYWIYNRIRRQRVLIDLKPLKQEIEKYWQEKGLDFRDISYQAVAVGWEGERSNRVVFEAFTFHQEANRFLGIWSVAPAGREPKLLAEKKGGFAVRWFGESVDRP